MFYAWGGLNFIPLLGRGRRKSNLKGKIINYLSSSFIISVDDVDLIIIILMHAVNGMGACEVTTKQPKCIICICVLI